MEQTKKLIEETSSLKMPLIVYYFGSFIIFMLIAYLACDIDQNHEYGFLSGFWHGLFWVFNLVIKIIFGDWWLMAGECTWTYYISYFISAIVALAALLWLAAGLSGMID